VDDIIKGRRGNEIVAYLKKKKMYEMLQSLVDTSLGMMKSSSYKFHRGSEWLECESDDTDCYYKLYHSGCFFSLYIHQFDWKELKYIEIDRITYKMIEGQLVKEYQRTEAYKKTEEIKEWIENRKTTN